MGQSYYRWSTDSDVPLFLKLTTPSQTGATGKTPEVSIRRARLLNGTALDGWYWDGAGGFNAAPQWFTLTEYDASNWPGLYLYDWEQTLVGGPTVYLVYFRHTVAPVGFSVEEHIVTTLDDISHNGTDRIQRCDKGSQNPKTDNYHPCCQLGNKALYHGLLCLAIYGRGFQRFSIS